MDVHIHTRNVYRAHADTHTNIKNKLHVCMCMCRLLTGTHTQINKTLSHTLSLS